MPADYDVDVPYELAQGVYANSFSVWHTRSEFTIDLLLGPVEVGDPGVARLVGRVKIPTMLLFDLLQDISAGLSRYEREYGEIPRVHWKEE